MTATGAGAGRDAVLGRRIRPGEIAGDDFTYTVVEVPLPGGRERRFERRLRTRLRDGLVAERPGRILADCRIRDRSRLGARIQLDKDGVLPKRFLLTDAGASARYWATLVWQRGRDAGVRLAPVETI